jgi:hypothetical protein
MTLLSLLLAARVLDVVFVPDAANAPPVVVVVDDDEHRTISWAVAGGGAGTLADDGPRADLLPLPSLPKGASLVERAGTLSLTIDDAGAWQDAYRALPLSKVPALPVATATALRLVVDPAGTDGAPAAILYGSDVRVTGRAVVRADRSAVRAVVVAGKDVVDGAATPVDLVAGCGHTVPSAVSVVGSASLKLTASGPVVCAGPVAVVPVAGAKLDAKKDVAASGVVISR